MSNRDIKLENTLLEAQQGRRHMLKLCGASPRSSVRHSRQHSVVLVTLFFLVIVCMQAHACFRGLTQRNRLAFVSARASPRPHLKGSGRQLPDRNASHHSQGS